MEWFCESLVRWDTGLCAAGSDRAEPQRVHHCYRSRAHGEDVAQDSAHAGGCALKRFDERWVIVRLDLESAGPAVADVDDAGVLAGPLQHALAARGQALQVHARRFVGTMLAPHHAEDAKFGKRGLAVTKKLLDLFVLVNGEAVLPERLRRKGRSHGRGHGEVLLSQVVGRWPLVVGKTLSVVVFGERLTAGNRRLSVFNDLSASY